MVEAAKQNWKSLMVFELQSVLVDVVFYGFLRFLDHFMFLWSFHNCKKGGYFVG